MKKVIAVLLSAVLFCLASGTAFAAGCNHNYSVLKRVNAVTGEIGPFLASTIRSDLLPIFQRISKVGLDNCILVVNHTFSYYDLFVPLEDFEYDYSSETWYYRQGSSSLPYYALSSTTDVQFSLLRFRDTTGEFITGQFIFDIKPHNYGFSHFLFAKPFLQSGFISSEYCEAWSAFKNNPDFPKITFDIDLPPPVQAHNLTINYIYTNGQEAAPVYSAELAEGESYSIPSPAVEGYAPDRLTVDGTMGAADVLETVIYNPDAPEVDPPEPGTAGTVTVRYLYEDGSTAAPTKTQTLGPGQMFQILSPEVPGYSPTRKIIFGYTGSTELVFDVTYTQQTAASAGGIFFAPPDKQDGITWTPGGNGGITWQPNNGGGITFQPKQSGGIAFFPPKSIGAYPFDIPRRWSLWS